jgi:hypothetical protein
MKLIILITCSPVPRSRARYASRTRPPLRTGAGQGARRPYSPPLGDILSNAQTNIEKSVFSNAAEKQEIGDIRAILIDLARENKRLARIVAKLQAEP